MDTPYKIDRLPNQLHYTYLDTFGRPVLVATKTNLVEHHIQDVVVSVCQKSGGCRLEDQTLAAVWGRFYSLAPQKLGSLCESH